MALRNRTRPPRWRALGTGYMLAAGLAAFVGLLEPLLSGRRSGLAGIAHSVDLHLLAALAVTLVLRLVAWRSSERRFPLVALTGTAVVEGAVVVGYRLAMMDFLPPLTRTLGKLAAAGGVAAGIVVGAVAALLLARAAPSLLGLKLGGTKATTAGLLLAGAVAVGNPLLAWRLHPRDPARAATAAGERAERSDVIIVLVDALRRDHVTHFGYERPATPNIDALMRESLVFTNAWTPSTWTIPSVASLFTGLYPRSLAILGAWDKVPEAAPRLAEHFRGQGYRTAAFIGNQTLTSTNGYAQGFQSFFPPGPPWWVLDGRLALEDIATRLRRPVHGHEGWALNRGLFAWLRANEGHPRFVYLHYLEPHSPYDSVPADREAVAPGAPPGPRVPPTFEDHAGPEDEGCGDWECLANPPRLSPSDLEGMIANYDAEIHNVDRRIGALLEELTKTGVLDRAHLIFCNDHGEEFDDHGGWFHGKSIYEEMIACPLAWRPPGGVPGGQVLSTPISILDLVRTVCVHAGLGAPPLHQGRELPAAWFGFAGHADAGEPAGGDSPPTEARFQEGDPVLSECPPHLCALRSGRWKLIRRGREDAPVWRLFDLEADPREQTDLAWTHPDTVAGLRNLMEGMFAGREFTGGEVERIVDPQMLEKLRALGYIR